MGSTKRMLLTGVIAAIALLALPAMASASVWMKNGEELAEFVELNMVGTEVFENGEENVMACEVKATLTTEGGEEGLLTSLKAESCGEGVGKMAGCELATDKAKGLPWEVQVKESDLTVAGWHTKRTFTGTGCETAEIDQTISSVTLPLQAPSLIETIEFSGENEAGYKVFGSWDLAEEDLETYGIG